ncbi:MAG: hypothetical protein ABSD02_08510 [Steroidobacteraceae bacterium]|jgi:hypothetical protein
MTPTTPKNTYLFERIFVCLAILSPIVMVIVAGMRPEGTRGAIIVTGHMYLAATLGLALALRVVYLRAMTRRAENFGDRVKRVGLTGQGGEQQLGEHRYG